jgi:hypothetical protein
MIERLSELEGKVQSARAALEGLAERAARLRARLEAADAEVSSEGPPDPVGTQLVSPDVDVDAPAPTRETSALASSLERLTKTTAWVPAASGASEGDDGRLVSDAWEIALISEEGK